MKAVKFDKSGKKQGETELPADLFNENFSKSAIYAVVRAEQANRRQGNHKTKERAEVSGGGKKPWRQKGTGNARQGSIRAAQWRGGGTVFGPRPRSYRIDLPEKVRRAGIRSIFSSKAKDGVVNLLEDFAVESFSTKAVFDVFKAMGFAKESSVVFVTSREDEHLKKSMSNIPNVRFISASRVTAPELYYASQVVIAEPALADLEERYRKVSRRSGAA